jgi:hypothetical protein
LPLDEVKSGKHHILFDCGIEAGQFQSRIDAVEKVTRLSRMLPATTMLGSLDEGF